MEDPLGVALHRMGHQVAPFALAGRWDFPISHSSPYGVEENAGGSGGWPEPLAREGVRTR